jgi:hypothetical protein
MSSPYALPVVPKRFVDRILRETLAVIGQEKAMQADLVRLGKAFCAPLRVSAMESLKAKFYEGELWKNE